MIALQIVLLIIAYIIGSIPFSFIVARSVKGVDLRYVGEGNVGARNVWHVVGKGWGILAGVLDFSKGFFVFLLVHFVSDSMLLAWLAGVSVVIGHGFPLFLRGLGGKGAATATGFLFGMYPLLVICSSFLTLIIFVFSKNFHVALTLGISSFVVLGLPLAGKKLQEIAVVTGFLLLLGLKRIIDQPHMKEITEQSGWEQ